MGREDGLHGHFCIRADFPCPCDESVGVPLEIGLMIRWHMGFRGAVLTRIAVQPGMRADSMTIEEDFNDLPGYSDTENTSRAARYPAGNWYSIRSRAT